VALTLDFPTAGQGTTTVNAPQKETTIGTRFPGDMADLLDAVSKRRGDKDRAATIRFAVYRLIEEHFPGSTKGAA
jgi:metal-responsive CopG/Arc/MetJ family transcriptional regulator